MSKVDVKIVTTRKQYLKCSFIQAIAIKKRSVK